MTQPLISIIVPCYNQAHFLEATLNSVLNQTYKNWECIVINDGSPDHTESVAVTWQNRDTRFKYISQQNGGLSNARNSGIKGSIGDFFLFLDADDLLHKEKLQLSVQAINTDKASLIISDFLRFKEDLNQLKPAFCKLSDQKFTLKSILLDWDTKYSIPIHCGIFSKKLFDNTKFNETLKAKEDWFMWIQIFQQNPKVSYIDKALVYYRKNPESMTRDHSKMLLNTEKAYVQITEIIADNLRNQFLGKIFKDASKRIQSAENKSIKYKKLFLTIVIISAVLLVLLTLTLILCSTKSL